MIYIKLLVKGEIYKMNIIAYFIYLVFIFLIMRFINWGYEKVKKLFKKKKDVKKNDINGSI